LLASLPIPRAVILLLTVVAVASATVGRLEGAIAGWCLADNGAVFRARHPKVEATTFESRFERRLIAAIE
jgi:Na+/glutamate symporter